MSPDFGCVSWTRIWGIVSQFSVAGQVSGDGRNPVLLHQPNRRMFALPGPEKPEVCGYNRTIVLHGKREIDAIPQRQLVLQRQIERVEKSRAHVK